MMIPERKKVKYMRTLGSNFMRTWVNRTVSEPSISNYDGERYFDPEQKTIYERVNGNWILKYCNRSCMPIMDVLVMSEGTAHTL